MINVVAEGGVYAAATIGKRQFVQQQSGQRLGVQHRCVCGSSSRCVCSG